MMKDQLSGHTPTVLISEPHPYHAFARFGGHQYARAFASRGWNVILVTASFNLWRLFLPDSGISKEHLDMWRERGRVVEPNITNYTLAHILPTFLRYSTPARPISPKLYIPRVKTILKAHHLNKIDLLWLNGNEDWLLRRAIPHSKLLVRIIDDYSGFGAGYDNFHPLMRETMLLADAVFACTDKVRELYSGFFDDIKLAPNGVEFEFFTEGAPAEEPEKLRNIPRPRITYVGAIADWFDFELVVKLAKRMPNLSFVIIGSWSMELPISGSYPENIYILGPIEYSSVPTILAWSDVGLVPFRETDLVHGVSPIKVYEYLAAGLPVVSLRWPALESETLPIFLASNEIEFEKGITEVLSISQEQKSELQESVRSCSWERRLATMLEHVGLGLDPIDCTIDSEQSI